MNYFDTHIKTPLVVEQNLFKTRLREEKNLPCFEIVKNDLPQPMWETHEDIIATYWLAWEIAFRNLRKPTEENGFISNYIDTAYNNHLFLWDSVFITFFGHYGTAFFDFQKTLDNLYTKQHLDGFICREIDEANGEDIFERFDPGSTGPNVLALSEWEYYLKFEDKERLTNVFPVILAYHRWMKMHRTWPDKSYWLSGFASGMDNSPRQALGYHTHFSHGHMSWIDACAQQVLSGKILMKMNSLLGSEEDLFDIQEEIDFLTNYINTKMWDEETAFYYDRYADGSLSFVKTIGSYWTMLAGIVPDHRIERFVAHLDNEKEFKTMHRIPSLSKDNPYYEELGDYWRGSVWAPTNYMVLMGLEQNQYRVLAHEIALNHIQAVTKIANKTGTLWENYAPEEIQEGGAAKPDFVGWTGLAPIAVLIEFVFGIKSNIQNNCLIWDVRLLEAHGVRNYPFGKKGNLNLRCEARKTLSERPEITIETDLPIKVCIMYGKESYSLEYNNAEEKR